METKPRGYWNIKENVFAEARKYKSRNEFRKGCSRAYHVALKNGWLEEMVWFKRPVVYNKEWTRETVFEEARKYETRSEFSKGSPGAYQVAWKNGWLDELFPKCEKWDKGKSLIDETKKKISELHHKTLTEEQRRKMSESHINGKKSKVVLQCDLDGNIIGEFPSTAEVQRQLGYPKGGIADCCRGENKSSHGFIWRYKYDDCRRKKNGKCSKAVLEIDKLTGQVIAEFPSISEAQRQLGISRIYRCLSGKRKTCGGFIWRHKENVA